MASLAGSGRGDPSSLVPNTETDRSSATPSVAPTWRSLLLSLQPPKKRIATDINEATVLLVILIGGAPCRMSPGSLACPSPLNAESRECTRGTSMRLAHPPLADEGRHVVVAESGADFESHRL